MHADIFWNHFAVVCAEMHHNGIGDGISGQQQSSPTHSADVNCSPDWEAECLDDLDRDLLSKATRQDDLDHDLLNKATRQDRQCSSPAKAKRQTCVTVEASSEKRVTRSQTSLSKKTSEDIGEKVEFESECGPASGVNSVEIRRGPRSKSTDMSSKGETSNKSHEKQVCVVLPTEEDQEDELEEAEAKQVRKRKQETAIHSDCGTTHQSSLRRSTRKVKRMSEQEKRSERDLSDSDSELENSLHMSRGKSSRMAEKESRQQLTKSLESEEGRKVHPWTATVTSVQTRLCRVLADTASSYTINLQMLLLFFSHVCVGTGCATTHFQVPKSRNME